MAQFTQIIKSGKSQAAYSHRQALLGEIDLNVNLIKDLDQDNPIARTFNRLESNVNELLDKLKLANVELATHLVKANPQINNDESYITNQKLVKENCFQHLRSLRIISSCLTANAYRILLMLSLDLVQVIWLLF